MTRAYLFLLATLAMSVALPAELGAQDGSPRDVAARTRASGDRAEMDLHAAAVATTADAADAIGRAMEIEAARRVAPFDLDWGTP